MMTHNHGLPTHSPGAGGVAQSVEQGSHKPRVVGSIPATATTSSRIVGLRLLGGAC